MSLAGGDLTTIATLQGYMPNQVSPIVLSGLITRLSRSVLTHLNRYSILPRDYSQKFNGTNTRSLVLPNWPVLEIGTLYVSGSPIALAGDDSDITGNPYGYRYQTWNGIPPGDPAVLELVGGSSFAYGGQNVSVAYTAGYRVTDEAATVPSASEYTVTPLQPYGIWALDLGVTVNGAALTAIASGSPAAGEYLPPAPDLASARNYYTFNSSLAGQEVLLTYGFVPADIEQAVLEFILDRSAYRGRPGVRSQMLASQETIVYDNSGLSRFVMSTLDGYISVLPPALGASV